MSKELVGKNGYLVGTKEYFNAINKNSILWELVNNYNFNYYITLKIISTKCSKMFDEIYDDFDKNIDSVNFIDIKDKNATVEIISGMADLCKIVGSSRFKADRCISLFSSKTFKSSISGATDKDITKSAKYVQSNKYLSKKDSIKVLEDCIKYDEKKATKGDVKKGDFLFYMPNDNKKGFLEDVLNKVKYLESNKSVKGKCGYVLCSKEYNEYIASAVKISKATKGNVNYGYIVRQALANVYKQAMDDLDKGIRDGDYMVKEKLNKIKLFFADIEKCDGKSYTLNNISKVLAKLDWFVGGNINEILKLQRKLNSKDLSSKLKEDGVFGKLTEQLLIEYIKVSMYKKLPLKVKQAKHIIDNNDVVIGIGWYGAAHEGAGGSIGTMIYMDEDFDICVMDAKSTEITFDADISVGAKLELSLNAGEASNMAGLSYTGNLGLSEPVVELGISGGLSQSLDGSVSSVSLSGSYGLGFVPFTANGGISYNEPIANYNPVEYIKKRLGINQNNY